MHINAECFNENSHTVIDTETRMTPVTFQVSLSFLCYVSLILSLNVRLLFSFRWIRDAAKLFFLFTLFVSEQVYEQVCNT